MRLSISNIAWDVSEDEAVAALLQRHGVAAIDVAPGKYFPDPAAARAEDMARVRGWWDARGLAIHGMQALLFGTSGLNVFGGAESQEAMLAHLDAVCRIGDGLDARRLVFGSPKNRDRAGLTDQQALDVAVPFFRRLGDMAAGHGVVVCLEPNPPCYGANFMTTSAETAEVVAQVDHAAIRMQLDTGAMAYNGEDAELVVGSYSHLIGHVHASEPQLVPVGDPAASEGAGQGADHAAVAAALAKHLPGSIVAIEMLATKNEPHVASIERAVRAAVDAYCPEQRA